MAGAVVVLLHSATTLTSLSIDSVLGLINDMLFVVIILELLWIMLSYLGRRRFPIASFIIIGIISSIRRILLIEAQSSFHSKAANNFLSRQTIDLLLYVLVVLILVFLTTFWFGLPPGMMQNPGKETDILLSIKEMSPCQIRQGMPLFLLKNSLRLCYL